MTLNTTVIAGFSLLVLLLMVIGCGGGDGLDRCTISGRVELDGTALAEGQITLTPLGSGVSAGGTIRDGQFVIAAEDGPVAGRYRVEIHASRGTGEMVPDDDFPDQMMELRESIIPGRYQGSGSELTIEVTSDVENVFPLALESGV